MRSAGGIALGVPASSTAGALAVLLLVAVVTACSETRSEDGGTSGGRAVAEVDPALVVAEDKLGEITFAEVDRFLLDLPAGQRWQATVEPAEQYAAVARRLAVDRLLYEEAMLTGADLDPELQVVERRILRTVYSERYLDQQPATEDPLTEDDLRAFYEENRERFDRQERREVSHVFKRYGGDRQAVLAEMAAIRQRALAGESFEILAREHSDSETRHDGGRLGLVPRGRFPEDFDRVVFALEVGEPSLVVRTAAGAHIFLVSSVLEGRSITFEEVRRLIFRELELERRTRILAQAADGLPLPAESFLPNREEAGLILRGTDPGAQLLRIGDFHLTVGELREQVRTLRRQLGGQSEPDLPFRLLDEVRYRELIYQHLLSEGLPEVASEAIEKERRRQLIEHYARRKMTALLEHDPQRIQDHYENNMMRFSTPVKVRLRHLIVPRGENPPAVMARLEEARLELDAGRLELAGLAESLGGRVNEPALVTAAQLRAVDRQAPRFAFLLKPGEHSPPYRLGKALVMFRLEERQEPAPLPLSKVRDRVVRDYLEHYTPVVFQELSDALLDDAGFRVYTERLAAPPSPK